MRWLSVIREGLNLAVNELVHNKLRTFLSLLGITIGIFCIIAVFSAVDSLEKDVMGSMEDLGDNAVYVDKWPWAFADQNYAWWDYINRPESGYSDFRAIERWSEKSDAVAIAFDLDGKSVKQGDREVRDVSVAAVSHQYDRVYDLKLSQGRYFSRKESVSGANLAIIGAGIWEALSAGGLRIQDTEIKVMGQRVRAVGVLEKEGQGIVSFGLDDLVIVPYKFMAGLVNVNNPLMPQQIIVGAKEGVSLEELKSELRGILRSHRRLRPKQDDNFALNQMSIVNEGLDSMFGVIRFAGGFIGIFSILVGGFGIANIMFVSVKERTSLIGIKKALGAKNGFVLSEFLLEAVLLCLVGGILGLIGVFGLMQVANASDIGMTFVMSSGNIITGLLISAAIGLISGLAPALWAARMDPVVAIRS